MPIEIKIPRLGWSMDEGIFSGWLKKNGEPVKSGEPLFTLEGEKSSQDIESTDSGLLHIPMDSAPAGATVKVGQVIGHLIGQNEANELKGTNEKEHSSKKEKQSDNSAKVDATVAFVNSKKPDGQIGESIKVTLSSPRARRRATELGVEVTDLEGSGSKGRIIESDVLKAAADRAGSLVEGLELKMASASARQVSAMRRNIAERTALSFATIPHFYVHAEVDATELVKTREYLVGVFEREFGVRITLTDFILRAQTLSLREFPDANAVWQNNGILNYSNADIGVVVGLPDGLVIPVITATQNLSFVQLAKERARLVEVVRKGQFNAEIFAGGATSISNLGTTRTDEFSAIIAPHQSSMLAVGRAAPRPYVVDGRLEVRTTIRLCLSVDHRILDGGLAADFLGKIVGLLENPKALVDDI